MKYGRYLFIIIVALLFLFVGLVVGYFFGFRYEQNVFNEKINTIRPLRNSAALYQFINPLLLYITPSADQQWGLAPMKDKIQAVINEDKKNTGLQGAAVFFQDLNQGRWMGVNQNDQYSPASMLKVVIMVSYFKKAESNPGLLTQPIAYTQQNENSVKGDSYNQSSSLVVGRQYAIDDLIRKMIVDSDNGATVLLMANIDKSWLDAVYDALRIQSPDNVEGNFTISPRYYSFFFRILYSATYLNDFYSEKALGILSAAKFSDGLVAGVPENTSVAHKYGEYVNHQDNQIKQIELHDCGIIYYPHNPYLLCVMTSGTDLDYLKNTIKKISAAVYKSYAASK